jgi:O-phosphoseryl-tRNA synthetase
MFSSPKKPAKKVKKNEPTQEPIQNNGDATEEKKKKKVVKIKSDTEPKQLQKKNNNSKAKKMEKRPDDGIGEKSDKKKKEPKAPVDARVIDATYEDPIIVSEIPKPEDVVSRDERISYLTGKGTQHPVQELVQNLRTILINSGFNEVENSFFVAETDILKQHDIDSNLIFDNVFYLAESPRPTISLTEEQIQQIRSIEPAINLDKFTELLNDYKDNKIENYQILIRLMAELQLTSEQVSNMMKVIPEFNEARPKPTNITLRSTMVSGWFTTLAAILDKEHLPIKIFSTGIWFKRGPKLNELKLSSHYGTSCIILDENITANHGKVIGEAIVGKLGFKELVFKKTPFTKNFNITTDEQGIFVDGIEIVTFGLFSEDVLRSYGIDIPALYINFGLEHMVMVQKGISDIRELMYPQFYKAWKLNDQEIGEALQFIQKPKTELGNTISEKLIQTCELNGNAASPCEFTVWEGKIDLIEANEREEPIINNDGKKLLTVKVVKHEKDSKLCGPAYLNEVVVKDGDIFGMPTNEKSSENGITEAQHTNIRYLDAFSKLVGRVIERKLAKGGLKGILKIERGIIKEMDDINLQLDGGALRYLTTNNKKIDIRGPMFVNIECSLTDSITSKEKK